MPILESTCYYDKYLGYDIYVFQASSTKCCVVEQEGVVLPNDDIPTNVAFIIQEIMDEMEFDARCQRILSSLTPRQRTLLAEKLATVK